MLERDEILAAAIAAEEWARQHEAEVSDQMGAIFRDRPADEYMLLLAAALRMVAYERKEAGNG